MIVDDYVEASEKYRDKYGPLTVCLFQIGDFFEMNAFITVDCADNKLIGADIYTVCDICNLQVTRKNKSIVETSRSNPLMAGFPLSALPKYTSILLSHSYTVVVVRQVSPPPNVVREVTEILSPSTVINPNTTDANYLMCIVFDPFVVVSSSAPLISIGIAAVDLSTGHSIAYEAYSSTEDPNFTYDEVSRLLESYSPRELYVLEPKSKTNITSNMRRCIDNCVQYNNVVIHNGHIQNENKIAFQQEIFRRAFRDEIGLENHALARTAFTAVLQFSYEHNDTIIKKLMTPTLIEQSKYLTLQSNSAVQLQVIGQVKGELPLLSILNRCSTAFGRRMFKERLLSPLYDIDTINKRYDDVESLMTDNNYAAVSKSLSQINDIERMLRRMRLGSLPPLEWPSLHESLTSAISAASIMNDCEANRIVDLIHRIQEDYLNVIDMKEATKYILSDIKGTVFNDGYSSDVDEYNNRLKIAKDTLYAIQDEVAQYEPCMIDSNDRDGYYLNITKKRWDNLKSKAASGQIFDIPVKDFDVKPISTSSSVLKVTHSVIKGASDAIIEYQRILQTIVTEAYQRFVAKFDADWHDVLVDIAMYIGNLDISATNARNATEYNYTRPRIDDTTKDGSYVEAKRMRHPIIERIHTDVEYVPNDVRLGSCTPSCDMTKGLLLYGINSSGKSSYMKAVGLNVIMAQSGMFVAASSMSIAPFRSIFTRIQNNDNVYKRMSSFTVEMSELRNIFQRCDRFSLVLGDELCSGTESVSAISIVASGTYNLVMKNVSFLFATHLHELVNIPLIKDLETDRSLRIAHIHVEITRDDDGTSHIQYDRVLREGSGSTIYGLEVCEALSMPPEFIKVANTVRRFVQGKVGSIVDPMSTSRYNSKVYIDTHCSVCLTEKAQDTHHITYRCDGGTNEDKNLVPLCKRCHDEEHNGNLSISGYVATSRGRKLVYKWLYTNDVTKEEAKECPSTSLLTDIQINALREYVRYSISGWQIKRTIKSRWNTVLEDSVTAYVTKKLGKGIDSSYVSFLKQKLLVL